jgi:DNA helicase II / ATP-dependent DNA helicase PcrA
MRGVKVVEALPNNISQKIYEIYKNSINAEQMRVITHTNGPLLVKAGPGSGKTHSLILLTMNLLLRQHAQPHEIILCTYTEKAAYAMQDRLYSTARKIGYCGDLSQIHIGTIHSICNHFVNRYLHYTHFAGRYEVLDSFAQRFTIYQHLARLCTASMLHFLGEQWGPPWDIAKKLAFFFDRISEELIFDRLKKDADHNRHGNDAQRTLYCLTHAYKNYQQLLVETNSIDFAHLQKCMLNLLEDSTVGPAITRNIRYVLVDEYQDTNYIQQQILYLLASFNDANNLCVVGDEDQALYRFRGATLHTMKSFIQRYPTCTRVELTINYRSHPTIINTYNQWINSVDWRDAQGQQIERTKEITAHMTTNDPFTPSVFTLTTADAEDEAQQFASLIFALKKRNIIKNYGQVVLLLYSVRSYISSPYQQALNDFGIPVFCPRARNLFEQHEIQLVIACLATILHYEEDVSGELPSQDDLNGYIKKCFQAYYTTIATCPVLSDEISQIEQEILAHSALAADIPERHLSDYFYRIIFTDAFSNAFDNQQETSNLVIFSQLLNTFQRFYTHTECTLQKLFIIQRDFFHTFLCLLHSDGLNQFEDIAEPPPPGHVQIMTIHQAKGLEFPIVFVGNLHKISNITDNLDKILRPYYHRPAVEPEAQIPQFDIRRLYYVALSRAKHMLVLMAQKKSSPHFAPLWSSLLACQNALFPPPIPEVYSKEALKRRFSFTTHVLTYETCPRRFHYMREHRFISTHSTTTTYGILVHQCLEHIHKVALDGNLSSLSSQSLHEKFAKIYAFLLATNHQPLSVAKQEQALRDIYSYFIQNQRELSHIRHVEYDIRVEQSSYILTGTIDLLLEKQNGIEIIDFKTGYRPHRETASLANYERQLHLYAHAIEKQTGQIPSRLSIYWTSEKHKSDALMEIPCTHEHLEQATNHFNRVVTQIQSQNFAIDHLPPPQTCQKCDIRYLCQKEGLLPTPKKLPNT